MFIILPTLVVTVDKPNSNNDFCFSNGQQLHYTPVITLAAEAAILVNNSFKMGTQPISYKSKSTQSTAYLGSLRTQWVAGRSRFF